MHEQLAFVTGEATAIFQAILLESRLQCSSSVYCFMTALFYKKFLNSLPQTIQVDQLSHCKCAYSYKLKITWYRTSTRSEGSAKWSEGSGQYLDIALIPGKYLDIAPVAGQYKIYCPAMAIDLPTQSVSYAPDVRQKFNFHLLECTVEQKQYQINCFLFQTVPLLLHGKYGTLCSFDPPTHSTIIL